MKAFFRTPEIKDKLYNALESWKGTPYRPLVGVKGCGTDCILFVWEVMKEVNAVGTRINNVPMRNGRMDYSPDRALHSKEEVLLNILNDISYLDCIKNKKPKTGDICCYKFGRSTSHLGIYYEGYIYHAMNKSYVMSVRFTDSLLRKRLTAIYRVMERGN